MVRKLFQDALELPEGSPVKRSRRRKTSLIIQNTPETSTQKNNDEEPISETLIEIRKQTKQRRKMKQKVEEIHKNIPEPSSSMEDEQLLLERLIKIRDQLKKEKEKGKRKQIIEEEIIGSQSLRRSFRLRGKVKKSKSKETQFIDLGEETQTQSHDNIPYEQSPQNSPQKNFESNPRRASPGIDLIQHQIYDYIGSLEKKSTSMDLGTSSNPEQPPTSQETLTSSLKQEIYELEVLNRHIQREN